MKKLMIAAAIVCAAAFAQAAQINWGTTGSRSGKILGVDGNAFAGTAYLFLASDMATVQADLNANGVSGANLSANVGSTTTFNNYGGMDALALADDDKLISGTEKAFNILLVDGDQWKWSTGKNGTPTADVVSSPSDINFAAATFSGAWQSPTAAPEPTSGLLLLLGVAGLALKRRRA